VSEDRDVQTVFLTYMARSGSTFLADLLHGYTDIGVTLEAQFPDGIRDRGLALPGREQLPIVLRLLRENRKFRAWGIEEAALAKAFESCGYPLSFDKFLPVVLRLYFADSDARIWVYKNGDYIWHMNAVHACFPDVKVIFLMRDPRAIFNSQRTAINPATGRPLCTNPLTLAFEYRTAAQIVARLSDEPWFHVIRYEDLLADERGLDALRAFLGASEAKAANQHSYAQRIPDDQKHLHPRVGQNATTQRVDAWRQQLRPAEIALIQQVAGAAMQDYGYELDDVSPSALHQACFYGYCLCRKLVANSINAARIVLCSCAWCLGIKRFATARR